MTTVWWDCSCQRCLEQFCSSYRPCDSTCFIKVTLFLFLSLTVYWMVLVTASWLAECWNCFWQDAGSQWGSRQGEQESQDWMPGRKGQVEAEDKWQVPGRTRGRTQKQSFGSLPSLLSLSHPNTNRSNPLLLNSSRLFPNYPSKSQQGAIWSCCVHLFSILLSLASLCVSGCLASPATASCVDPSLS